MAEIYISNREDETAQDKPHQLIHKGDLMFCHPDGFSDGTHWWQSAYADTSKFLFVKCPEMSDLQGAIYTSSWKDDFDYEILANRPAVGQVDLRMWERVPGASGEHNLTRAKVESYLSTWNCSNIDFGIDPDGNEVTFTFSLWGAVRSAQFWEVNADFIADLSFELLSYNAETGIGEVRVDLSNVSEDHLATTIGMHIDMRDGEILELEYPTCRFRMHRSTLYQAFKADVRRILEKIYRPRRYYVEQSVLDWIADQGNGPTISRLQLQNHIQDKAA